MDKITAQLLKIQQQLSGLSASQKMLTATLVAIMVMTVVWWTRYASNAETEPVLDMTLSSADMGQVKQALDRERIPASIVGDRVMVPSERKMEAVAALAWANALPSNTAGAWDEMTKQMSPWDSTTKTQSIQNHMRERMISDVMTGFFPGVAKASVIINPVSERRVGGSIEPSASVQISTRSGKDLNVKQLVEAAASTVASAVPGLNKSKVSVVIDGSPRRVQDRNDGMGGGGDLLDQIKELEQHTTEKIATILPGTLIAVTVDLDITSSQETKEIYDAAKTFGKEKSSKSETSETSTPQAARPEVGAQSNTGLAVDGASAAAQNATTTTEKTESIMDNYPSVSREVITKPAGKPIVISAAIRIPRSAMLAKFRAAAGVANASTKEPDDAMLQALITTETPSTKKLVQTCTGIKSDENISVDMWYDTGAPMLMAVGEGGDAAGSASSGVGGMLKGHIKEIAVGALAVVSLLMVSTIVKKSAPAPIIPVRIEPKETRRIDSEEVIAGVVGDSESTLDGMELDEDAVRSSHMVEQVATMVKEDPEAAAGLVKRWLNRS